MKVYKFRWETLIPASKDKTWNFFSDPQNLNAIIPPEINFTVLTENIPKNIYQGLIINYSLKPLPGYKTKWISEISDADAPNFFIDHQLSGPYKYWRHKHLFTEVNGGTKMVDEIEYAIPFSFIGILVNKLIVRKRLNYIFSFRSKIVSEIFSGKIANQNAETKGSGSV